MLELYYLEEADSICSNRAVMTLFEKGIKDWVPHNIVLMNGYQFTPEYQKLNPKSQVPTLIHNGKAIRESSIIRVLKGETSIFFIICKYGSG